MAGVQERVCSRSRETLVLRRASRLKSHDFGFRFLAVSSCLQTYSCTRMAGLSPLDEEFVQNGKSCSIGVDPSTDSNLTHLP